MTHDPFRPPGHEFLFQSDAAETEDEARRQAERIFGAAKLVKALFVRGRLMPTAERYRQWQPESDKGYRVYIPLRLT